MVFGKEALGARVAESAMCVTRAGVEAQNAERKRFIEHLRRAQAQAAAAALAWDRLIDTHTHEKGQPASLIRYSSARHPIRLRVLIAGSVRRRVARPAQLPALVAAGRDGGPGPRARAPAPGASARAAALPQAEGST